jgi:diguanylate cyclase (GGDEF)-like protein
MRMALEGDMIAEKNSMGKFSGIFDDLIRRTEPALGEKGAEPGGMAEDPPGEPPKDPSTAGGGEGGDNPPQEWDPFPHMTVHEDLTGALGRDSFTFRALIELYAALAQGKRCCLAVAAPDYFQDFNDRYGRAAGDEALEHTAKVVGAQLRKTDFIGRWDGEELAVFFLEADLDACRGVCERILQTLAFTPLSLGEKPVHITASIGITAVGLDEFGMSAESSRSPADDAELIKTLVGRAEQALYEAKRTGGSRVVSLTGNR